MRTGLVIGGGIAGLTTAVALERRGIRATVYESAPAIREVGTGIWVATNAMQVLHRLGLASEVARRGTPLERACITDRRLRRLSCLEQAGLVARYGHPITAIHRADLHRVLIEALGAKTLVTGKRFTDVEDGPDHVTARFEDGTSASGEFLIGADGIHSAVRKKLFPEVRLRYSGQTCWRGVAELDLPDSYRRTTIEAWGGRIRFGFSEIGSGRVYWFAVETAPAGGADDVASLKDTLSEKYRSFDPPIGRILASTPASGIVRNDLQDFLPIPRWHRGRICLIGDAAHAATPNLGQGGAQAIEDGWLIAERLSAASDVRDAFERFQAQRIRKTTYVVKSSYRFGKMAHLSHPAAVALRNLVVRMIPDRLAARGFERLARLEF